MLARVLCESVYMHLICSDGKLTTQEVAINGFFPKKNWEIFTEC
jgi:hypothetical protein